ncbi:hypothetical protein LTR37_012876 [Vermiconidia calcicola]|uniref:Uncharacterized protein n=1 Tax=Vermiconidia calcicola TaxID=1690605 RepID=A0ACC3MY03_9PEZI|nr:hypothetical protein LTR37_012876 [Vermiconidia calcicola]
MFFSGVLGGAGLGNTDPEQERDAPPEPTVVTFPVKIELETHPWNHDTPPPDFQSIFSTILRPTDITDRHATALNIRVREVCPIDDLVPRAPDGSSNLPPAEPDEDSENPPSYADAAKSNPAAGRKRKEFEERLAELQVDNDLAYRTISRTVATGVKPPRLAYMRKFWEGLDMMAQYWDCSLDAYFSAPSGKNDAEKSAKRQRLETHPSALASTPDPERSLPIIQNGHSSTTTAERTPSLDNEGQRSEPTKGESKKPTSTSPDKTRKEHDSSTVSAEPRSPMRYKGRRTKTGSQMPDQFRVDTVRAFVEGTVWPFRASVHPPRTMPLIHFNKLNLPVRQTAAVYRVPSDRTRGRQGWLEGPILNLQVRPEIDFSKDTSEQSIAAARLDVLREVGALLQLAQHRRREGKIEVKSGEGQWWTTKPRWGGGPGGEVQNEIGNTDILQAAEELLGAAREKKGKASDASRERKRKTPAMLWKELKCGKGYWDPKTEYTAIGKDPASAYDEVRWVKLLERVEALTMA